MNRSILVMVVTAVFGVLMLCAGGVIGLVVFTKRIAARQEQYYVEARARAEEARFEQVTPPARAADFSDPKPADRLVLTLNGAGQVLVPDQPGETLNVQSELKHYLDHQRKAAGNKPARTVVLHADRSVDYQHVYRVRQACKDCGFATIELSIVNQAGDRGRLKVSDVTPDWRKPESQVELTLTVKTMFSGGAGDGAIAALIVRTRDREVAVPNLDALSDHAKNVRVQLANKDLIRIAPEGRLKYAEVVRVVDACVEAGFRRVVLAAPPDLEETSIAPATKTPAPDAAAIRKIEQEVQAIYRADYARTEPADRIRLAARLRDAGNETAADPTARFVLLSEAARLAAVGGEVATALRTADDLAKWYTIDTWDTKYRLLEQALPQASRAVSGGALQLAAVASFHNDADRTARFSALAAKAAQTSQDVALQDTVELRRKLMARLQALRADTTYRDLVRKEQAGPATPEARAELADDWWDLAGKAEEPEKRELLLAARRHYERVIHPGRGLGAQGSAVDRAAQRCTETDPIAGGFPGGFAGRFGKEHDRRVREGGGNARSEAAIAFGLKWIVRHQALDGHWGLHDFHAHGRCNCGGHGGDYDVAGTALALLPLLGAGQTHRGLGRDQHYSKQVERGLQWLLLRQGPDGTLSGNGYEQALATVALCEAYGLTGDAALRYPAQKALDACVAWQHEAGGFRYRPRTPGDLSVTAWFIQALYAGRAAGLDVPAAALTNVGTFLDSVAKPDGSGYGYMQPLPAPTMTAAGLHSRRFLGWKADAPGLVKGWEYLRKLPPSPNFRSIYYYYYATQFVYQMAPADGEAWQRWNARMRDLLIDGQDQGLDPDRRDQKGSWSPDGDAWGGQLGRLGYTALALLTLEVYYRHLPLTDK